jgi:hypothetical protein
MEVTEVDDIPKKRSKFVPFFFCAGKSKYIKRSLGTIYCRQNNLFVYPKLEYKVYVANKFTHIRMTTYLILILHMFCIAF